MRVWLILSGLLMLLLVGLGLYLKLGLTQASRQGSSASHVFHISPGTSCYILFIALGGKNAREKSNSFFKTSESETQS